MEVKERAFLNCYVNPKIMRHFQLRVQILHSDTVLKIRFS